MAVSGAEIATWLLQTAAAAGVATTAFFVLLPTKFGEKYLGFHFDRKLADLKDAQNQKIEKLKEQLAHLGDRGKRSNELEFTAIRAVWEKFVEAWLSTYSCIAMMIQIPDFPRMQNDELLAFLETTDFSGGEKKIFMEATDRTKAYSDIVNWRAIARAGQEIFDARLLLRKQRIFMPHEIRKQFADALDILSAAQVERRLRVEHRHIPSSDWGDGVQKFIKQADRMFEELADAANARLFRDESQRA
jgi:hypothetical protein